MAKETLNTRTDSPWLSAVLLMASYLTYGGFLHSLPASVVGWGLSLLFAVLLSAVCTIGWNICRRVLLMGFQSDMGYFLMALMFSSLAVAAVSQFRMFSYLSLLVAVSLLTRVDMLIAKMNTVQAFLAMLGLALLGMGIAWLIYEDVSWRGLEV